MTATRAVAYTRRTMTSSLRIRFSVLLGIAILVVGYVQFAQHVQGYEPCELCLRERLPWYAIIAVAAGGVWRPWRPLLFAVALSLLVSAGLALHHVGVEQKWWRGPEACTADFKPQTIEELRAMLKASPVTRCDEIVWRFLGLSMTSWNFLLSIALLATLVGAELIGRSAGRPHHSN